MARPVTTYADLTGREFGRFTVLGRAKLASKRPVWKCLCDPKRGGCGVERDIRGDMLQAGRATKCLICRAKQTHQTSAQMQAHVASLHQKRFTRTCPTCRVEFTGTARQKYCCVAHRPSSKPKQGD